jgi:hypothetical protein
MYAPRKRKIALSLALSRSFGENHELSIQHNEALRTALSQAG